MARPNPMPEFGPWWFTDRPPPTHCRWCGLAFWRCGGGVLMCATCDRTVVKNWRPQLP